MSEDITMPDILDGMDVKQRGELKRAVDIVKKIEADEIDITENLGTPWGSIAFSFTYFGEEGRDLFMRVSRFAPDYLVENAEARFEKAMSKVHAKSPGGFYKACKNAGIDLKVGKSLMEGVKGKQEIDPSEFLPEGASIEDWKTFGFWEQDNRYYSITEKGTTREVTNFTMQILYHLRRSRDEAYRIMKIKNDFGFEQLLYMNTDDFVTVGSFRKAITRYGRYLFKGNDTDLMKLQDKLQREEISTKEVNMLGFDKKSALWFFSNGLCDTTKEGLFKPVDDYGIIEHESENYFIPAMSKIYEGEADSFENEKLFLYMKSETTFKDWSRLFCKVYPQRGMMGIVYWFASIHRDVIFDSQRRFPILNLYGQKGSGKGAMAESMLKLFGRGQHQLMLGGASTVVGFMRKLGQLSNALVWLDEYKNNLGPKFTESLKNIYDGIGYERGKKDNTLQTKSTPVKSAVLLSGQEMPTIEPALFSRVILVQFEPLQLSEGQRTLYRDLSRMEDNGISFLTVEALKFREKIEEKYEDYFTREYKSLVNANSGQDIIERMIINYAMMIAIAKIMGESMELPFRYEEFKDYCQELLSRQHHVMNGSDDASKFWEIVEHLFNKGLIMEGHDFELNDGEIHIRIQNVYGEYAKELRQRNDPNVLQKTTLENYLESDPNKYINKKKKVFSNGTYTWGMVFNYSKLGINLIRATSAEDAIYKNSQMGINIPEEAKYSIPFTPKKSLQEQVGEHEELEF
jgi:hypothetical protein